jgi:membrane fusion protein, multidrug efflux system
VPRPDPRLLVLLLLACSGPEAGPRSDREEAAPQTAGVPTSAVVTAGARLEAASEAILFGGGRIVEVLVEEGDSVSAGQLLVSLSGDAVVQGAVSAGHAGFEAASLAAENRRLDYQRCLELFDAGAISELELEGARTSLEAAEAACGAARAGLSGAVSGRSASVVQAPFDGVIGRIWADEGCLAGAEPLLMMTGGEGFRVRVLLPEREIGRISAGGPATFTSTALPGLEFEGTVSSVSPALDPVTLLLPVEAVFLDSTGTLVPGLYGTVAIERAAH